MASLIWEDRNKEKTNGKYQTTATFVANELFRLRSAQVSQISTRSAFNGVTK
jgi:hypothetical protein